ncbi:unnamed protein product [Onchocerca flexuosa]|uniref:BBS1 domain-containing protein n=1 Tax=Onchocerca flexuosa TaxID=387005 RepID=A0A183HA72_9BILA|nr:unnamed protein product [Onchocerca flexuosa]
MNASTSCWVQAPKIAHLSLNTIQSCVCLADLHADGDYKLVIGDFGTEKYGIRLKIFKGFQVIVDNLLSDLPSALISFNNENVQPNPSSLALACETTILIYKNLKPFYKFATPPLEINKDEAEAWRQAEVGLINATQLHALLMELLHKLGVMELTTRSQKFLSSKEANRERTLELCLQCELVHQSTITCMTTLKRSSPEVTAIDCIVYATEYGYVYCIDTQAFTVLAKCKIPGIPVFLHAAGSYDVDYRIFVSTREAEIFKIKRDMKSVSDPIITMPADIIGMIRVGKQLVVACTDKTISFFAANGKCQNKITLNETIRGIDTLTYEPRQYIALLVALEREVRIYDETSLLDKEKVNGPVNWIRYGQFGYEEGALVIGTTYGGIIVKLFRRKANLEKRIKESDAIQAQSQKISIPRRTQIYIDQTRRERENARLMHQCA